MEVEDFKEILYEKEDNGIVTVTLNMPKRKNALSLYTYYELFWAVEAMEKDDTAGVMIITGAKDPDSDDPTNEAFSSGGYFNPAAMAGLSEEVKSQLDPTDIAQKRFTLKMWQYDKPVIAAVNGLVIGGAFTMRLSIKGDVVSELSKRMTIGGLCETWERRLSDFWDNDLVRLSIG